MTARFTITIETDTDGQLLSIQRFVLAQYLGRITRIVDGETGQELPVPRALPSNALERNQEIIRKYVSDPKRYSSIKLGEEYGISRERVCQILRPVNAIGRAKARLQIAKDAVQEQVNEEKLRLETLYTRAVELVRNGMSIRQAAVTLGWTPHGKQAATIRLRLRALGIQSEHGRWNKNRFDARKARVKTLLELGYPMMRIVRSLKEEGDTTIYQAWVLRYRDELRAAAKQQAQQPPIESSE